jgi:hypothetical protein
MPEKVVLQMDQFDGAGPTHQMCLRINSFCKNPIGLGLGQILDHCGSRFASRCADAHIRWSLHGHKCRCFLGLRLAFASAAWWGIVLLPPRLAANVEAVDLNDTIKRRA